MNKNMIGFVLFLVAAFWITNSPFYKEKFGGLVPEQQKTETVESTDSTDSTDTAKVTASDSTKGKSTDSTITKSVPQDAIEYREVTLVNKVLSITISEKGGVVRSAKPLEFTYAENLPNGGERIELIDTAGTGIAGIAIAGKSTDEAFFRYDPSQSSDLKAVFEATVDGENIKKVYALTEDSYYVDYVVTSDLMKGKDLTLSFGSAINESEDSLNMSNKYSPRELSVSNGKKVKVYKGSKKKKVSKDHEARWFAISSKYFGIAAILPSVYDCEVDIKNHYVNSRYEKKEDVKNKKLTGAITYSNDDSEVAFKLFFGPTKIKVLKEADVKLDGMVYRGWGWFLGASWWFPGICNFVNWLMGAFFFIVKDYGIAILLLTILLRVITFPLTQSSMKSMKAMKEIQPKIQAIQEKYKNNPELQRAKMMEFYQTEGINPLAGLGGCFPMFLQMPIMISLFVVLRKSVELRGETTFLVPWLNDLSQPEALFRLPFEIPFYGSNFALLPLLYAGLMFFSNKMTMKDPNQRAMVYVMPAVMLIMFNNFPSGLTMYFVFSNVLQLIQQHFVNKGDKSSKVEIVK